MRLKTLHGEFDFQLQRFRYDGQECSFFELTQQCQDGYLSRGLQEMSAYYSNRLSYAEVEELIERLTGQRALSDQGVWQGVMRKAVAVSQQTADEAHQILQASGDPPLRINSQLNLYDPDTPEILLFEDGIQVKRQTQTRNFQESREMSADQGSERKRVNSDVVLLQKANGSFGYLTTPIKEDGTPLLSLEATLKAKLIQEYGAGTPESPLYIVAIVDGARSIRCRLESLFGASVPVILDWYHLSRKVRRLMGMIAENREQKRLHLREVLPLLWALSS